MSTCPWMAGVWRLGDVALQASDGDRNKPASFASLYVRPLRLARFACDPPPRRSRGGVTHGAAGHRWSFDDATSELLPGTAQQAGGGGVERSETTEGRRKRRTAIATSRLRSPSLYVRPLRLARFARDPPPRRSRGGVAHGRTNVGYRSMTRPPPRERIPKRRFRGGLWFSADGDGRSPRDPRSQGRRRRRRERRMRSPSCSMRSGRYWWTSCCRSRTCGLLRCR